MSCHPSHVTRFSFDASTWDEMCIYCGNTDMVPGGWGQLEFPCPVPECDRPKIEQENAQRGAQRKAAYKKWEEEYDRSRN